jgi:hypothetical protein
MKRKHHWQIKTYTMQHYVSTVWLDILGIFETMVFRVRDNRQVDWHGEHTWRTDDQERAIVNHCDAIWKAVEWEAKRHKIR